MDSKQREYLYRLREVKRLYLQHPQGITDDEMALLLRISRATAYNLRQSIIGISEVTHGRYSVTPTQDEADYARAVLWRLRHDGDGRA